MKLSAAASRVSAKLKELALRPVYFLNQYLLYFSRLSFASARGAANAATRVIDPADTLTWEFSGFSQNGEDGIIDHLATLIREPNRYFLEIGASDGLENNTSYLALVKKYNGIMVEGSPAKSRRARRFLQAHCLGVEFMDTYVNAQTARGLVDSCRHRDPDVFSLDIDGIDYYVAESLFENGFRPKVVSVEYNSAFGPDKSVTIPLQATFDFAEAHPTRLYYGVSLAGWQTFFKDHGYEFVTVDFNGVNAFFVDPEAVDSSSLTDLNRLEWQENCSQWARFHCNWQQQFDLISQMPLESIRGARNPD